MGGCLSCAGPEPIYDGDLQPALAPKPLPEATRISVEASARWPSTEVGSLHPHATFSSDGQNSIALDSAPAVDTTGTESSVEVLTPSPTYSKTPGENPFTHFSKTELVRTPVGPLENSPSDESNVSTGDEAAVRNKNVSALFDKLADSDEPSRDFDIPAVRTTPRSTAHNPHHTGLSTPEVAEMPLSMFKMR